LKYISTRGENSGLDFDDVLISGLASDGGLYLPDTWPTFSKSQIAAFKNLSYGETAFHVMRPFINRNTADDATLKSIINDAYSHFDSDNVAELVDLGDNQWMLELFHGPTLAFKDMAMQFLGPIFDHVLSIRQARATIVGATSGDTGSAAIEACRGREALDVFILYPHNRVSDVQRRQMTTVADKNVHAIAINGTFDDCQDLVKSMFNDQLFRNKWNLSAVNSINWARIMAQIVYYFYAAVRVGAPEKAVAFSVPTGNFGNIFAGFAAKKMGLPIEQLIVGTNQNDILDRFFKTGIMKMDGVNATISPSMDIQISSNFERLLFDLFNHDHQLLSETMTAFRQSGEFCVNADTLSTAQKLFSSARFDDDQTKALIKQLYQHQGKLIDPHSAVGLAAGRACINNNNTPLVTLATAHPAKFPDATEQASGVHPALPDHLSDLFDRPEHFNILDNDLNTIEQFISNTLGTAS